MHKRVKLRIIMFRLLAVLAMLSAWVNGAHSSPNDSIKVLPDSSNFVTASLLVATPTNTIYSVFGHATLRLECPVHNLDYVFTFESDTNVGTFMTGVAGKAIAKYVAVSTSDYLREIENDKRGVTQYELNLTVEEEKELWRLLDEDMMAGGYRHFNLLFTNCLSTSIIKLQQCLQGEYFEWGPTKFPQTLVNGELFRYSVRNYPWVEFLFVTVGGTVYDEYSQQEYRLVPEFIVPMLQEAHFVNIKTGEKRPVFTGKSEVLIKAKDIPKPSTITPTWVFGLLLLFTILLTIGEWVWKWKKLPWAFDALLLTAQTLMGLLLLFVTVYSELFGSTWNWYLVVFNPIPILTWLFFRKKKFYSKVWLLFIVVLVAFLVATPFMSVLDTPHQMITASMLVRCISKYKSDRNKV